MGRLPSLRVGDGIVGRGAQRRHQFWTESVHVSPSDSSMDAGSDKSVFRCGVELDNT
ncbi:hypothetical protein EBESD8_13660 [Rhodococcus aetherivorans]|nr:hypothetical protein EBESD8_13660 [Rhodococcus aetherivorans]